MITRRAALALGAAAMAGCDARHEIAGGFTGASADRGHLLRDAGALRVDGETHHCAVLVAGGGIAGLSAARALVRAGIDDVAVLELEDEAGGNSRAMQVGGLPCPMGAHYVPVPGDSAPEVRELFSELGLMRFEAGRWICDEMHLCHSPQERLFFQGAWQEGLLPVQGVPASTLAQYRAFSARIAQEQRASAWPLPLRDAPVPAAQRALDGITFAAWLDREGYDDPHLRWYLDYCCRDDYGAGAAVVSAWAGVHYFASRHGFQAPGEDGVRDALFTWPEGNGWLARRLAEPMRERIHTGRIVLRVIPERGGVEAWVRDSASGRTDRWIASACVLALPLFVASRVLDRSPDALRIAAGQVPHAPWIVGNAQIDAPLRDRGGASPSWDNVLFATRGLGYVDAGHQSLRPDPGQTVLTWYRPVDEPRGRSRLLAKDWAGWRDELLQDLAVPHPDLRDRVRRIDFARFGHAIAVPAPGVRTSAALAALRTRAVDAWGRVQLAHADLAGYSIFEEAYTLGLGAARRIRGARSVKDA